jgi:hypothetical protein
LLSKNVSNVQIKPKSVILYKKTLYNTTSTAQLEEFWPPTLDSFS